MEIIEGRGRNARRHAYSGLAGVRPDSALDSRLKQSTEGAVKKPSRQLTIYSVTNQLINQRLVTGKTPSGGN